MRKILVIILFAVATSAAEWEGLHEALAQYPLNVGYSSLGRIEADVIDFRLAGLVFNTLRVDVRVVYDDDEYDTPPVSLGAAMITVPAMTLVYFSLKYDFIIGTIAAIPAYLAAGELHFTLLNYEPFKLTAFESHVFEWWLYKKNGKWYMDEAGWGQELGMEMSFPYVSVAGGVQFEMTNKRTKSSGLFARVNFVNLRDLNN